MQHLEYPWTATFICEAPEGLDTMVNGDKVAPVRDGEDPFEKPCRECYALYWRWSYNKTVWNAIYVPPEDFNTKQQVGPATGTLYGVAIGLILALVSFAVLSRVFG